MHVDGWHGHVLQSALYPPTVYCIIFNPKSPYMSHNLNQSYNYSASGFPEQIYQRSIGTSCF
jgi:hypothetical protein